jgi:Zn-dependent protease with chaperone function
MATSIQTTVYNIGIAAGSLAGGLILQRAGAAALPWVTSLLSAAALATVATARRHAFPADRTGAKTPRGAAPERAIRAAPIQRTRHRFRTHSRQGARVELLGARLRPSHSVTGSG